MKSQKPGASRKKVVVLGLDGSTSEGYLDPAGLGRAASLDLLTAGGERHAIPVAQVRCVYFVRDFGADFAPERTTFYSRPKLEGLWVRVVYRDNEAIEGVIPNDLLDLFEDGVQITPPDLHGNAQRIFIPRSAVAEMKVLGVVGATRRFPARPARPAQPRLFEE